MKGAIAALLLVAVGVGALVVVSRRAADESPGEAADRPGLAWERPLPVRAGLVEESRVEPRLGRIARQLAGRPVQVRCWSKPDWEVVFAEWRAGAAHDEVDWVLVGFAQPGRGRIHLSPEVCDPLGRFVYGEYAPFHNTASLLLAQALAVLAHEAEHLRDPGASEALVECLAMQRIRRLVTAGGRSDAYAAEMAALAFEISYPHLPREYRTRRCRNGGPLDQNPRSSLWP